MQVKTGKGTISAMVVIAIWSLSLAVDLPGLAVTPIEGSFQSIFPDVTDFKIQLLTVLPNLVIIPFVLLSGKLSETKHKIPVILAGIVMYLAAGVLYMLSHTMNQLIWLSCLLGAGCGLILPFSTGLIADVFTGKYRMKQMGIISAIGNIALVCATFIVGWFDIKANWHLPFLVYLIPAISLVLLPWLKKIPASDLADKPAKTADTNAAVIPVGALDSDGFSTKGQKVAGGFYVGRTFWLLCAYFFFVFASSVPCYYMPNLMPDYGLSTGEVSAATSLFYAAMFVIGLALTPVLRGFRKWTFVLAMGLMLIGFLVMIVGRSAFMFCLGAVLTGLGNGIAQPIFYDKATEMCNSTSKATLALAYLQVANYVGISLVPVIVNFGLDIFSLHDKNALEYNLFPFQMVFVLTAIVAVFLFIRRNHFVFGIHRQYYEDADETAAKAQPAVATAVKSSSNK